jgi:heptosyltransferase-1
MTEVLFIKTSSLGDVVHHMPALTDARKARSDATFTWLVEEAFAPLVQLHPAVDKVIPVASRRWRKSLYSPTTMTEIATSFHAIRAHRYDDVVDSQGLLRTALIARIARGRRHGYDSSSVRESLATYFYQNRYRVDRGLHAVERNRVLTGLALGYEPPGQPDYGLDRARFANSGSHYAMFLHGTARPEKQWPQTHWIKLGQALGGEVVLPWGSEPERTRSERIAAEVRDARVPRHVPLDQVAQMVAGARYVVGVDTGLLHLAAAFGVPLVAIFTGSNPKLTAPIGRGPVHVIGDDGIMPSVDDVVDAVKKIMR